MGSAQPTGSVQAMGLPQAMVPADVIVSQPATACALHQLAVRGGPATQPVVAVDAALWAYDKHRHGARVSSVSLLIARVKRTAPKACARARDGGWPVV